MTPRVPAESLRRAQAATGRGIAETVRLGLEPLAAAKSAGELRGLRSAARSPAAASALQVPPDPYPKTLARRPHR